MLIAEARGRGVARDVIESERIEYRRDAEMPYHLLQYSTVWLLRLATRMKRAIFRERS